MTGPDSRRPQDIGRRHRRASSPSPATAQLLGEYQDAMRAELRQLLVEIRGEPAPAGLLDADQARPIVRPSLRDRAALWELAIKLGRALGDEIDPGGTATADPPARPRARRRVDYG